jgi:cytochrome c oxidase subunit 3
MRRHLFHILPYSPWPILSSMSAFFVVSGLAFYMHKVNFGGWFFIFGLICLILCAFGWLSDIVDEATFSGYHTKAVRSGLKLGFILFIVSEFMLFFGFFWAFFHAAFVHRLK